MLSATTSASRRSLRINTCTRVPCAACSGATKAIAMSRPKKYDNAPDKHSLHTDPFIGHHRCDTARRFKGHEGTALPCPVLRPHCIPPDQIAFVQLDETPQPRPKRRGVLHKLAVQCAIRFLQPHQVQRFQAKRHQSMRHPRVQKRSTRWRLSATGWCNSQPNSPV